MLHPTLSAKQSRFVEEYLLDGNGAAAAVRAGYSAKSARAIASENLTKPDVLSALQARQGVLAKQLEMTRQGVVQSLLEAVQIAREDRNPMGMIAGYREIGRLLGFYTAHVKIDVNTTGDELARMERMTDAELEGIICGGKGLM